MPVSMPCSHSKSLNASVMAESNAFTAMAKEQSLCRTMIIYRNFEIRPVADCDRSTEESFKDLFSVSVVFF